MTPVGGLKDRKVVDVVGGDTHTMILLEDGSILAAGSNTQGQLGQGKTTRDGAQTFTAVSIGGEKAAHLQVGPRHSCAVTPSGQVFSWGDPCEGPQPLQNHSFWRLRRLVLHLNLAICVCKHYNNSSYAPEVPEI